MNIAVELRNIAFGASGGVAQLVHGVLDEAMRRNPDVRFVVFATMFNSEIFSEPRPNVDVRVLPLDSYWQDIATAARQEAFDVIFRGYPGPEIAGYPGRRQVVLIPDIQHETFPHFFSTADLSTRRAIFHSALANAGAIGTISEYARSTLLADPANRCKDVFLMPPGSQLVHTDREAEVSTKFVEHVKAVSPYLFYPANLWQHKNHERLLAAHESFCAGAHAGVSLVLTGHPEGWNAKFGQRETPRVHHLGFVSQTELRHLYRNALALVFPSLYEGFGMPLLEAFENGCPVACSNTTSLPEVAGDAALMFDPASVASIADAMTTIASDATLRESLVVRGHARAKNYSWPASADALLAACRRVASASSSASTPAASTKVPLVSIVTPSFNQGRFLRRTIDSVLTQDYPNIELCVMDGGSTDDSVAILQSYGDRINWVSENDNGQTHAINKGLARSHGDIFAYLNSDDTLAPGAVRRIVEYLATHPACDMVYGDANYIDESDTVTGKYNTAPYSFERLMFDCCVCQPAAFWRAAMTKAIGPFDESLDFVMDYDYWLRIDRAGGAIRYLPGVLANSRLYPETKTMSRRGDIYREIFKVCRRRGGYVDRNYYIGYWNHLVHERPGLLGDMLRVVPNGATLAAKVHFAWNSRRGTAWQFVAHEVPARLSKVVRHAKAALHERGRLARVPRVEGLFSDGWLAPLARIRKPRGVIERRLFVSGRPAVPCVVNVDVDGVRVHTQRLSPEQISRIEISAQGSEMISLRFSGHAVDQADRRLAFLVFGTNLFSEADLTA